MLIEARYPRKHNLFEQEEVEFLVPLNYLPVTIRLRE